MKKLFSIFLTFVLALSFVCNAGAVSLSLGKTTLQAQFLKGEGPEIDGYTIDYRYFSPVKENDDTKYPVVIWIHGHSHGQYEGYQIESNDIVNWASDEYQARLKQTGGAYIIAVRAPENKGLSWSDELVRPLKATIDDFIEKHSENVDSTRIYIGGFSLGGMMTFKMAAEYPDMFAAAFPICPYITIDEQEAQKLADIPIWLVSGKNDPFVSYSLRTKKNWDLIVNTTNLAEDCRFSTLSRVCKPNGSRAPNAHYSWICVTYDMFSDTNEAYPHMSTVTAAGESVSLDYPDGMISWLSGFSSDYHPDTDNKIIDSGKLNISFKNAIAVPFMIVYMFFRNLFRPIFG